MGAAGAGAILERVVRSAVATQGPGGALVALATGQAERATLFQLGPLGRLVVELAEENARLRLEVRDLSNLLSTSRPLKRRSPGEWRFRVTRWERVTMPINPRATAGEVQVPALRLYVPTEDKPEGVPYWDVTSQVLQAQLTPLLPRIVETGAYLHLRKRGDGIGSLYTVSVEH